MADYVLDWPLSGSHVITAGYYYSGGSLHQAIDLRVEYKQPVLAAGDGTVNFVYSWNGRITSGDTNSYGNCVKILHNARYNGGKVETLYAHLDSYIVRNGQSVKAGQVIGYAGYTGNVVPRGINGKHLHFEVRYDGVRRNPLVWLDNDFTTKDSSVYTFGKGERSAIRETTSAPSTPSTTVTPSTPSSSTSAGVITFKNGTWNVRKGPGTNYAVVGTIKSPGSDGKKTTINYETVTNGWYKTIYGYVGPDCAETGVAAQKSITFNNGTWNIRKGPGTNYGVAGTIKSPGSDGKAVTISYESVTNNWYKTVYGYVGPAAIKSHT